MTTHPHLHIIHDYIHQRLNHNHYTAEYQPHTNEIEIADKHKAHLRHDNIIDITLNGTNITIDDEGGDTDYPIHLDLNDPNFFTQLDQILATYYGPHA